MTYYKLIFDTKNMHISRSYKLFFLPLYKVTISMMRRLRHQYVIILKVITFVIDFHKRLGNTNVMLSVTSIFTHILEMLPAMNISYDVHLFSRTKRRFIVISIPLT